MRKLILYIVFASISVYVSAQSLGVGLGGGYSSKSGLAMQGDLWLGRFYLGLGAEMGITDNVIGKTYSTINPGESIVISDRYSEGSYTGSSVCMDMGYRLSDYFTMGASFGLFNNKEYINCYDSYHILGNDGYYNVVKTEDKSFGLGLFLIMHYPIGNFAPYFRVGCMTESGLSWRIGLSYHFGFNEKKTSTGYLVFPH